MIAAVIDLGTNTFHLIIASISSTSIEILFRTNEPVRLGQGRINDNIIIPEAFDRGIDTLRNFRKEIDKYGADTVKAIATSAVRSSKNGIDFVIAAKKEADIDIEVINGDEEATYIFKGVKATGVIKNKSLVMDIGGGSTEFIICDENAIYWKKSYNIGAARLTQAYFKSDPISRAEQSAMEAHLDLELSSLKEACALYQPKQLIGSAGAFETFATMLYENIDLETVKSAEIELSAYQRLAATLINATHAERAAMPRLIKLRVDMIVTAAILTNYVILNCDLSALSLSTYDLKMGVLDSLAELKIQQGFI